MLSVGDTLGLTSDKLKCKIVPIPLFREFTHAAPDELASGVVLMTTPDGLPVAGIVVCYNRPIEKRERILHPLRSFVSPLADAMGPILYTVAQKLVDTFYPPGLQEYWTSSFLTEISDAAIDTMEMLSLL
jgi:hypothetical protein